MTDSGPERILAGIAAADGLVVARLAFLQGPCLQQRQAGDAVSEAAALRAALRTAADAIEGLAAGQDELAAEILEFQLALIEDEDLLAPVYGKIAEGTPAEAAWAAVLDHEIAEYRAGGDAVFSVRADDLLDLRDRVSRALFGDHAGGERAGAQEGDILVATDLTPSLFLELDWTRHRGAAICGGSPTSHVAILARARGIPLVVGLGADLDLLTEGEPAVLDAEEGRLILAPRPATLSGIEDRLAARAADEVEARALIARPAQTAAGDSVAITINVDDPAVLDPIHPDAVAVETCDGIGLARTEFLFEGGRLPGEAEQLAVYRGLIDWARGRPVTVRTLDAGGDKPIPGVTPAGESNPFLGLRGLRLSLRDPALFTLQLRALARAAAHGPLKVMLPMVTEPAEVEQARGLLDRALAALADEGLDHARPPLGMMVEVPAAALTAERFEVDFFSIGSNDLVQYVTACARDNPAVAALADPANPAVLELIARTVTAGRNKGIEVSLCGDMASVPASIGTLLDCGLRSLSVAPAQLARVKLAVSRHG